MCPQCQLLIKQMLRVMCAHLAHRKAAQPFAENAQVVALLTLQLQGVHEGQHIDALRINMRYFLGSHCAAGLSASNPRTFCRWN